LIQINKADQRGLHDMGTFQDIIMPETVSHEDDRAPFSGSASLAKMTQPPPFKLRAKIGARLR
jgi:hypothetical protein